MFVSALSPLQKRPVCIRHHFPLSLTDEVSLLFVGDGPALLNLTQLLQTVIKTLRGERKVRFILCVDFLRICWCGAKIIALNLSLITCRSLSFSWRKIRFWLENVKQTKITWYLCRFDIFLNQMFWFWRANIMLELKTVCLKSDLGSRLEDGHVPVGQVLCDFHPTATKWNVSGSRQTKKSLFESSVKLSFVYLRWYVWICCSISSLYEVSAFLWVTVTSWIKSDLNTQHINYTHKRESKPWL